MEFDADAILASLLPWHLKIKIGGKFYEVHPPTIGDLALMEEISKKSKEMTEKRVTEIVCGLLVVPPPIEKFPVAALPIVISKIMDAVGEYLQKKSMDRIAAGIAADRGKRNQSLSGDSSSPSSTPPAAEPIPSPS